MNLYFWSSIWICVWIFTHMFTYGSPVSTCIWLYSYDYMSLCPSARMGCLWLVGSIKSYVSFAKEPYKRDNFVDPTNRSHPICIYLYGSMALTLCVYTTMSRIDKIVFFIGLFCKRDLCFYCTVALSLYVYMTMSRLVGSIKRPVLLWSVLIVGTS